MTYTIHVRVIQTNPDSWYNIVEKTAWVDAYGWTEINGEETLTMQGSGTSGTLRFTGPKGDSFLVATGVHNYKRWSDIVVNLKTSETGVIIHPTYYGGSRDEMLWKQLAHIEKDASTGLKITVDYYNEETNTGGNTDLYATITIS